MGLEVKEELSHDDVMVLVPTRSLLGFVFLWTPEAAPIYCKQARMNGSVTLNWFRFCSSLILTSEHGGYTASCRHDL